MSRSGVFTGDEIVRMAIQTEQDGQEFYSAAAQAAESPDVKQLLEWLAHQEQLHEETFKSMLADLAGHRPSEEYSGQKSEYVEALLHSRVLPDAASGKAALANMSRDMEAIDFALGFEKDTILFMYEMRDLVGEAQAEKVNELIVEEKRHVKRLNDIKAAAK